MMARYASRVAGFLPKPVELDTFAKTPSSARLLEAFRRLTRWFRLLHDLRVEDETSILLSSAHSKVIEIWVLIPLHLIHSSYTSLRTIVDICTSYTFYYSHPIEWRAVCEGRSPWLSRARINKWHLSYTPAFKGLNDNFGLVNALNDDYQKLSSYVHSIPLAGLPSLRSIDRTSVSQSNLESFIEMAERIDYNLSLLFLAVAYRETASLSQEDLRVVLRDVDRSKLTQSGIILPRP